MPKEEKKSNRFGIFAFVLSILGVISSVAFGLGIIFSITALILSIKQSKKYQNKINSAAFVMSFIGILLNLLVVLFFTIIYSIEETSRDDFKPRLGFVRDYDDASFILLSTNIFAESDQIRLNMESHAQQPLEVIQVKTIEEDFICEYNSVTTVQPREKISFILEGENCNIAPGVTYGKEFKITYRKPGDASNYETTGVFFGTAY